jgi:poly-gamma-glutamate system protein
MKYSPSAASPAPRCQRQLSVAAAVSLIALAFVQLGGFGGPPAPNDAASRAERIMRDAMAEIRALRGTTPPDLSLDPNQTGLIGPEISPLVTTLGQADAKRSTTNPQMAGILARMLQECGVRPGDVVAIGSSGSFPALLVASLSAVRALNARPVTMISLGASSFGATDAGFDLMDLYSALRTAGLCSEPPAAVSLGGDRDTGGDFEPEFREHMVRKIAGAGLKLLDEPVLARNVQTRMAIYREHAGTGIAAFINCGGGFANLGTSELVLRVNPGLHRELEPQPPANERGVLHEMARAGVPVIHLLFIKGLAQTYGLPWDPVPLPTPGRLRGTSASAGFWIVCALYFCILGTVAAAGRR